MSIMNKIITTDITDPFLNLAIENNLLVNISEGQRHLFMFINDPCVVIGRFQNPWIECNITKMHKEKIPLLRRQSGGGTVYHDHHNVNFSFIADRKIHSQNINHQIVVEALSSLNVKGHATARGDIRLSDETERKISGSAFKQKKDQAFHHGTMLINSNLEKLNAFILSDKQNLETKSISSVRSNVANISEFDASINQSRFIQSMSNEFKRSHNNFEEIFISKDQVLSQDIYDYARSLKDHNWKILETPKFQRTLDLKNIHIDLEIKKAKILKIEILYDSINPLIIDQVQHQIIGKELNITDLQKVLSFPDLIDKKFTKEIIEIIVNDFNLNELPFL